MTKLRPLFRFATIAIMLAVAACAPYSLMPPATTDVAGFRVENDIAWNKANQIRVESPAPMAYWTADGPSLNAMFFIGGVKDGMPVLKTPAAGGEKDALVFRSSMSPSEIVELWEATTVKLYQSTIAKGSNIEPVQFAGTRGFRFDFHYVTKDEVERAGIGYAAVKDDRLYMIFYSGTKLHHYNLRLANAKRIMETARISG